MDFGILLFFLAAVPVLIFLRSLQKLRNCLSSGEGRMRALLEMPVIIVLSPMVITVAMMVESQVDPDFLARSFTYEGEVTLLDYMGFAYDQAFKGALFDVIEVFNLSISRIEHKCDSLVFCTSLLLYRTSVGLAFSIFLFAIYLSINEMFSRDTGKAELQDEPEREPTA